MMPDMAAGSRLHSKEGGVMRIKAFLGIAVALALSALVAGGLMSAGEHAAAPEDWKFNATIIEACSCPMFCQCYFNSEPAEHHGHAGHGDGGHFCRFNNAFHVNKGKHGKTDLSGIEFWVAGDLGGDFSQGKMDWAVLTFDPSVTAEQRAGIQAILPHIYPVEWGSFSVAKDAEMSWKAGEDRSVATLDGGKTAEVVLVKKQQVAGKAPVIHNLQYWGAARNDGFVLMPNEVEAYRVGDKPFEFKGTNGFMITLDMTSKDVAAAKSGEGM
jgi:hypothetical protein